MVTADRRWAAGSTMSSKAGARSGSFKVNACRPLALVANPTGGQRCGLQFLNTFAQRDARQTTGAADPRDTAIA